MYISCCYKCSNEKCFSQAVAELLGNIVHIENVVRLVFFGSPADVDEFIIQRDIITVSFMIQSLHIHI